MRRWPAPNKAERRQLPDFPWGFTETKVAAQLDQIENPCSEELDAVRAPTLTMARPRGSRLANPVLARKRVQAGGRMAMLSGQQVVNTLQVPDNDKVKATAYFVVGGVVQTISAWLAGEVDLEPDQLVDQLGSVLDQLADPELYRA